MSEQQEKVTQISGYQELLAAWEQERKWQLARAAEERWLVYLCRRLPLYLAAGLMLFGMLLGLSLLDGVKPADLLALQMALKEFLQAHMVCLLGILACWKLLAVLVFKKPWQGGVLSCLLAAALLWLLNVIFATAQPVLFGVLVFSCGLTSALLADRMLGYSRRNERYQMVADKIEVIILGIRSKSLLPDRKFDEVLLQEYIDFITALREGKYEQTVSDGAALTRVVERYVSN
ncbi:hypothetical protein [Aeromonas enteropelogenes]|uniref:hypothetical protein n=1 Tax=Aeromonas enteropelogenes TaxID=29489 RepID=UPI003BA21880